MPTNIVSTTIIPDVLSKMGLDSKEIALYLQLLSSGSAPASALAKRVELPRSTAQFKCQRLVEKGLFKVLSKNNSHLYIAEAPEKLLYLFNQQIQELEKDKEQLSLLLPELLKIYNPLANLPKTRVFEGVDGIIEMFEDVLHEGQPLFGLTRNNNEMNREIERYLAEEYIAKRKRLRNPAWIIFNDNPTTRSYQSYDHDVNRISLLIPEKIFPLDACCHIYGHKVAFYSYSQNDLTGILIENDHIYQSQRTLFEMSWNLARQMPGNERYLKVDLPRL